MVSTELNIPGACSSAMAVDSLLTGASGCMVSMAPSSVDAIVPVKLCRIGRDDFAQMLSIVFGCVGALLFGRKKRYLYVLGC
jgi:hypothetical protein